MRHCDCTRWCLYSEHVHASITITSDDSMLESSSLLQLTMREISYLQSCPCSGTSTSLNGITPIGCIWHSVTPHSRLLCSTLWHHYVPLLYVACNQPCSTLLGITWLSGAPQPFIWYMPLELYLLDRILHCDALRCRADSTRTFLPLQISSPPSNNI